MDLQQVKEFFRGVKDWPNSKIIDILENDQQTIKVIIDGLMKQHSSEPADVVYSNLFNLYQNGSDIQKAFVLQFLPALVWEYLFLSSSHEKKGYGKLEAVLLAIYNAEIVDKNGDTKYQTFRLPSLSRPSVYHEPLLGKTSTSALTESALSRHEQSVVMYRLSGPGHQLSRIPACHRFAVIAFVLQKYNHYITFMGNASLEAACKMASRAASCGFKDLCQKNDSGDPLESLSKCPRIPLDNAALMQMVYIVYHAMFNGFAQPAQRAFQALHFRAAHGLFSQAYLLTRSIEHLLQSGDEQALHAPLGLTVHTTSSDSESTSAGGESPGCLDPNGTPWNRRCPFEILIAEKPPPGKLELDSTPRSSSKSTEGKLRVPKDSRPKKAKSWASVSIGKPSPTPSSRKSSDTEESVPVRPLTVSDGMNDSVIEHMELVTGV